MVSPATRLLEKRRVMYEVQKAFEDQKEDFKKYVSSQQFNHSGLGRNKGVTSVNVTSGRKTR